MSDKDENITTPQEESGIFGAHRSDEELAAEAAARKVAEKAARKEAYEKAKEARRASTKETKNVTIVMLCILAAIVVGIVLIFVFKIAGPKDDSHTEREGSAHFYQEDALPEADENGISGCINEAYFTNGGHLALKMTFTNGYTRDLYMDSLEVTLKNSDGEKIASGYTSNIQNGEYLVPIGGYKDLLFYISPEYVLLPDDDLETLEYTITCHGSYENETAEVTEEEQTPNT